MTVLVPRLTDASIRRFVEAAPAATADGIDELAATQLLDLALHAPNGVTVAAAAVATGQSASWVQAHLDHRIALGAAARLGGRVFAVAAKATTYALLAGAWLVIAERGWNTAAPSDDGAVDLPGALRIAAGAHPLDLPEGAWTLAALYDAEDELVLALGADPTRVDADAVIDGWQAQGPSQVDAVALLCTALHDAGALA